MLIGFWTGNLSMFSFTSDHLLMKSCVNTVCNTWTSLGCGKEMFTAGIAPHQLVLQPTFISTCPLLCEMAVVALSTHCGVRANRTAAVASSFNFSMVTL